MCTSASTGPALKYVIWGLLMMWAWVKVERGHNVDMSRDVGVVISHLINEFHCQPHLQLKITEGATLMDHVSVSNLNLGYFCISCTELFNPSVQFEEKLAFACRFDTPTWLMEVFHSPQNITFQMRYCCFWMWCHLFIRITAFDDKLTMNAWRVPSIIAVQHYVMITQSFQAYTF